VHETDYGAEASHRMAEVDSDDSAGLEPSMTSPLTGPIALEAGLMPRLKKTSS